MPNLPSTRIRRSTPPGDRRRGAAIKPAGLPDPTEIADGELSKSGRTRQRILEAAVDCLAELGYAGTTAQTVAKRAHLTRAALLYHFRSRSDLIAATINYVTRRRIEAYDDAMAALPHDNDFSAAAVDNAWAQLQMNAFLAFSELSAAARTDAELRTAFEPALAEYDRGRRVAAIALFPRAAVEVPWFDLRRDIVRYLLEGFAQQQRGMAFDVERRRADLINFLKVLVTEPEGVALLRKAKSRFSKAR